MKNNYRLSVFGGVLLAMADLAIASSASPSLNNKCGYSVVTPVGGSGVFFDESCRNAYVLPPKNGVAEVLSLARTTNLQFCPSVNSVNEITARTLNSMNILSQKIEDLIKAYEPLDMDLLDINIEVSNAKTKMDSAKKRLEAAELHLQELTQTVRGARKEHENCVVDHPTEDGCAELKTTWDHAREELQSFRREEYREYVTDANDAVEFYELKSARYKIIRNRYQEAIAPMLELQDRMFDLNARVSELYREYVKLEGATGQIIWSVQWDQLLEDYRRLNPNLTINWQQMPIKESEFVATARTQDSNLELANISGVKFASIPGSRPTGFDGIGSGQKVAGPQLSPSLPTQASMSFGNSASGQITLNLMGACPYFDGLEPRTEIDRNELSRHITANLIYSFELASRRGYTASYNLSALLQKIEQKSKRGGFFSTSVSHSIIEGNDSSDWFSISFHANTSDFQYSLLEQTELTRTVKQEIYDKAIRQFAVLNAGSSAPPAVPELLDSGAAHASNELRKCWYYYCQVGSAILGIADSIWGRSDATANFHRNNSSWAIAKVDGVQFVTRSGSLSFRPE